MCIRWPWLVCQSVMAASSQRWLMEGLSGTCTPAQEEKGVVDTSHSRGRLLPYVPAFCMQVDASALAHNVSAAAKPVN